MRCGRDPLLSRKNANDAPRKDCYMDTITTTQNLLKSNGSAQPVMVALMPSEMRLIAAAPDLLAALFAIRDARNTDQDMEAWALAELAMSKATGESA
jgi:hypothetical protein